VWAVVWTLVGLFLLVIVAALSGRASSLIERWDYGFYPFLKGPDDQDTTPR
jgi:uncharacterized membrane protein YuzA (DUF378 family)